MGARKPRQSPIGSALFGAARQAVLRLLFEHPGERFYQSRIVRELGLGSGVIQRELVRLTNAGILLREVEGRQTYYQANPACPVFGELRGLVRKTFGVADVLRAGLAPLAHRIRLAFLYGSFAASEETVASDIDLMIVGDGLSLATIVPALREAQASLGREVNPSVYGIEEFRRKLATGHHFLTSVVAGPKIVLIGGENELTRMAEIGVAERTQGEPPRNRRAPRRGRS
jgi:predicted nucleotidyltransferase